MCPNDKTYDLAGPLEPGACAHCGILDAPMRHYCHVCDDCYGVLLAAAPQTSAYVNGRLKIEDGE
jgi:hypothetical protein